MSYEIQVVGSSYVVIKQPGGIELGHHTNREEAEQQVRELQATQLVDSSSIGCDSCTRVFLSDEAFAHHSAAVHGDSAKAYAGASKKAGAASAPFLAKKKRTKSDNASHSHNSLGSQGSTSVASLGCDRCNRAFHTVQGLRDHASMVHDKALDENNTTFSEIEALVRDELVDKVGRDSRGYSFYTWIVDMTDAWIVYSVEGDDDLLKADYTIDANGNVTIGDSTPVRRKTVYETVVEDE